MIVQLRNRNRIKININTSSKRSAIKDLTKTIEQLNFMNHILDLRIDKEKTIVDSTTKKLDDKQTKAETKMEKKCENIKFV